MLAKISINYYTNFTVQERGLKMRRKQNQVQKKARMKDLGDFLARLRAEKNVSVREVAEAVEISNPYLYQVERGKKLLSDPDSFGRLARYYGRPVEEFLRRAGYLKETQNESRLNLRIAALFETGVKALSKEPAELKEIEHENLAGLAYGLIEKLTANEKKVLAAAYKELKKESRSSQNKG